MIERRAAFNVQPDRAQDWEELFVAEYRPAAASSPGFVRADLLREQEDPPQYQNMIIWLESMETAAE